MATIIEQPQMAGLQSSDPFAPQVHRWTIEEYLRIAATGVFEGKRVELIEGQVIDMSPMGRPHATGIVLATNAAGIAFARMGQAFHLRTQLPFAVGAQSVPEPDIAVVPGDMRAYASVDPTMAFLVVEVAESSLSFDREVKQRLYARAGVPEYWIVNLARRQLHVFRDPAPEPAVPAGFHYKTCSTLGEHDLITPVTPGAIEIQVAMLFV